MHLFSKQLSNFWLFYFHLTFLSFKNYKSLELTRIHKRKINIIRDLFIASCSSPIKVDGRTKIALSKWFSYPK